MSKFSKKWTHSSIILLCLVLGLTLLNPRQIVKSQDPAIEKIESDDPRVAQTGEWSAQSAPSASGGSYLYNAPSTSRLGGEVALSLDFSGTSLEIIYIVGPSLGTLAIEVDGTVLRTVITTAEQTAYQQSAQINYLSAEPHTLKVYAQAGGMIAIDAFLVSPSTNVEREPGGEVNASIDFGGIQSPCDFTTPTQRPAEGQGGIQATQPTTSPVVTGNGRYVLFLSTDGNLVPDDTNGVADIFLRDRQTCTTIRISVADDEQQGNSPADPYFDMTENGQEIVFSSRATNLVPDDTNGLADVFVRYPNSGRTLRISTGPGRVQAIGGDSFYPRIAPTGDRIIYNSYATNLVANDTNGQADTFIYYYWAQISDRITVAPGGVQLDFGVDLATDLQDFSGRYTVIESRASNLVPGDNNNLRDIYMIDATSDGVRRVSVSMTNGDPNGNSSSPSVSSDGRFVAFSSEASNLVPGDTNGVADIFVRDMGLGTTTRIMAAGGAEPNGPSFRPDITANGRYVAFDSAANNFAAPDNPGTSDVFRHDRTTGETLRWNLHGTTGQPGTVMSWNPSISDDGEVLVFESVDALITADTNGVSDVFMRLIPKGLPDTIALFNSAHRGISRVHTLDDAPPSAAYTSYSIAFAPATEFWLMGDWDGDGDDTPGVYEDGVFWYANEHGVDPQWSNIWIGLIGQPVVSGRFGSGNADCIGAIDNAIFPPFGRAFALYYTCDLTHGTAPPLTFQWLSVLLPDSQGFSGTHQFGAGDFDGDGIDTIAMRRGPYITWTNTPPNQVLGEFPNAQFFGVPGNMTAEGLFVVGNWNIDTTASFGLVFPNGNFYYRNDLIFNSGIHYLQRLGQPVGNLTHVDSWR